MAIIENQYLASDAAFIKLYIEDQSSLMTPEGRGRISGLLCCVVLYIIF